MKFSIEDIVHNEVTNETGRIVRIMKVSGRPGYVVVTATKPFGKEIEALWRPQELKELRDRARKSRSRIRAASRMRSPALSGDFHLDTEQ